MAVLKWPGKSPDWQKSIAERKIASFDDRYKYGI